MNRAHLRVVGPSDCAPSLEEPERGLVRCSRCGGATDLRLLTLGAHECPDAHRAERVMVAVCFVGLLLIAAVAALANRV